MLELIAQGPSIDHRWRRQIPNNAEIELGRTTDSYRVPWDSQVSRRHIRIVADEHHVVITKLETAGNPVFFNGDAVDEFVLNPGQHFVIGVTTFSLAADEAFGSMSVPNPLSQKTFSSAFLEQVKFRDADRRIDVLNRLPKVIANANDPGELMIEMINTLMAGIATATTIGIVRHVLNQDAGHDDPKVASALEVIQWDRRGFERGDFQPSSTLVAQAVDSRETVLNVWHPDLIDAAADYTFDYSNDWAFACPIESPATKNWCIYVAGRNQSADQLGSTESDSKNVEELDFDGDIKFCELVGSTLKNLLQVKRLERQQASLRTFFSPVVVDAIGVQDADEVLSPRECDVTVLFCDLRGFARASEEMSGDLLGLLEKVSESLGIMTSTILDRGGVVGDFHGDAVMGFWGWPLSEDECERNAAEAIAAALNIQNVFSNQLNQHPRLNNFHVGLGLASGHSVAGKIGTRDQVKVTAFGPVVNLASRLEGMTRSLNSMILADRKTVMRIEELSEQKLAGNPICRLLGTFQPFGLQRTVDVFQVLPNGTVTARAVEQSSAAVECFSKGDWSQASKWLRQLPADDSARMFLESVIDQRESPPSDFDGVIQMKNK